MAEARKKPVYEGPLAKVPGLEEETIFANLPKTAPLNRLGLQFYGGWPGLVVSYKFLHQFKLTEQDYFLDVGCGMGEHVVLAGIGHPKDSIPKVRFALGLSSSEEEIRRALILARMAAYAPDTFREMLEFGAYQRPNLYRLLPELKEEQLSTKPKNIAFLKTNLFHLPLPDDTADKTLSSSVASYIQSHEKRRTMFKEILRVTRPGGLINISSYTYENQEGRRTFAPDEFNDVAKKLGVEIKMRPELVLPPIEVRDKTRKQVVFKDMVFEIVDKPKKLPAGMFSD